MNTNSEKPFAVLTKGFLLYIEKYQNKIYAIDTKKRKKYTIIK